MAIAGISIVVGLIGLVAVGVLSFGAGVGIYALETKLYGQEINLSDALLNYI